MVRYFRKSFPNPERKRLPNEMNYGYEHLFRKSIIFNDLGMRQPRKKGLSWARFWQADCGARVHGGMRSVRLRRQKPGLRFCSHKHRIERILYCYAQTIRWQRFCFAAEMSEARVLSATRSCPK